MHAELFAALLDREVMSGHPDRQVRIRTFRGSEYVVSLDAIARRDTWRGRAGRTHLEIPQIGFSSRGADVVEVQIWDIECVE